MGRALSRRYDEGSWLRAPEAGDAAVPGRGTLVDGAPAMRPPLLAGAVWEDIAPDELEDVAADADADGDATEADATSAEPEAAEREASEPDTAEPDAAIAEEPADLADDTEPEATLPVDGTSRGELPHRAQTEALFGEDLGGVTAHVGANLSALDAVGAAHGDVVAFAESSPSPGLVAHEVAHVVQQRRAGGAASGRGIAPADSAAEHEADAIGERVDRGDRTPVRVAAAPGGAVHLKRRRAPRPFYAQRDRFNRPQERGRPKVAVGRRSSFRLTEDATRYSIVGANRTQRFDSLAAGTQVTVNISAPRRLVLEDGAHDCVFVRTVRGGSAWMRSDLLAGGGDRVEAAARRAARRHAPARPTGALRERVFKQTAQHSDLALTANRARQSRSKFEHYLRRETAQVDGFYNICLNLPQPGTPPVQVDVARPGEHFFVMQTREVAAYTTGRRPRQVKRKWAFGAAGMQDAGGRWRPNRSRRGWVPIATLRRP